MSIQRFFQLPEVESSTHETHPQAMHKKRVDRSIDEVADLEVAEGQTIQNPLNTGLFTKEHIPKKKRLYMMCTLEVQVNYFVNGVSEKTIDFCKGLSSKFLRDILFIFIIGL